MHDESASNTILYAIGTTTCYYIFNAPSTQYFPRLQINFLPIILFFGEGALWPSAIRAPRSAIRLRQIRRACRAIRLRQIRPAFSILRTHATFSPSSTARAPTFLPHRPHAQTPPAPTTHAFQCDCPQHDAQRQFANPDHETQATASTNTPTPNMRRHVTESRAAKHATHAQYPQGQYAPYLSLQDGKLPVPLPINGL